MNEFQAVELGYARPNEDNHEWREGYHVLYPDGYHSWCPKHQFEYTNQIAETFLDRMNIELKDLREKLKKLGIFFTTKEFSTMSEEQQAMLYCQHDVMEAYKNILVTRIHLIESQDPFSEPNCEEPNCKCD